MLSDLLAAMLSFGVGFFVVNLVNHHFINFKSFLEYWPFLPAFVVVFYFLHLYPGMSLAPAEEIRRFFLGSLLAHAGIVLSIYVTNHHAFSPISFAFAVSMIFSSFFFISSRTLIRELVCKTRWWGLPAVVFGAGKTGRMIVDRLLNDRRLGYLPVAVLDDSPALQGGDYRGVPILGGTELGPVLARRFGIGMAIVAMPGVERTRLARIVDEYVYPFRFSMLIPDFFGMTSMWVSARDLNGVLGLMLTQRLNLRSNLAFKRLLDLSFTAIGGILILPFLLLIALAVKVDSPGSVLYGHKRLGRDGKPFTAWKFRSMVRDADARLAKRLDSDPEFKRQWESAYKLKDDPRITRVGRFLRRTSLDEFPQLINVLKGEMSLVGPRPIVDAEIEKYGDAYARFSRMTPGMTGLWQISGRSDTGYEERVALDSFYSQSWSFWLDIYILMRTVGVVFHGKGAY